MSLLLLLAAIALFSHPPPEQAPLPLSSHNPSALEEQPVEDWQIRGRL